MRKCEKVLNEYAEMCKRRAKLSGNIEALKERLEEKRQAAEDAAARGDLRAYMDRKADADRMAAELHVAEAQYSSGETIPADGLRDAWREYAAEYEKSMKALREKYDKAVVGLCSQFMDIVALYNTACEMRERLALIGGKKAEDAPTLYGMTELNSADYPADPQFFRRTGAIEPEKTNYISGIFLTHRSNNQVL